MTDERFAQLCAAQDFLAAIPFRAGAATENFWTDAEQAMNGLVEVIEDECPGYFEVRSKAFREVAQKKKDGLPADEVAALCDKITAQRGRRVFVWG
jgi:hypothetical protein